MQVSMYSVLISLNAHDNLVREVLLYYSHFTGEEIEAQRS